MNLNEFIKDWIYNTYQTNNKAKKKTKRKYTKRKYTKRVYSESNCDVYYDLSWLYQMNLPGEYIDFVKI